MYNYGYQHLINSKLCKNCGVKHPPKRMRGNYCITCSVALKYPELYKIGVKNNGNVVEKR